MPVKKKFRDYIHVCVCVPSNGSWRSGMAKSTALLFSYFSLHGVPGVKRSKITMLTVEGSMIGQLRETVTRKVCQTDATHLLFLDSDMTFPMTVAHDLLMHGKDFVAANCTTRVPPIRFVAHDLKGNRLDSRGKTGLQEVQHVGLAVALIEVDVIRERMRPPMYLSDWVPDLNAYCGEDVYFTQCLQSVGVKTYIDHDLSNKIGHIGSMTFNAKHIPAEMPE